MLACSLPAQTLVSQNPTDMTAAQTTTVASQTTTGGVTTTTYRSSNMNDPTGGTVPFGTSSTAYTNYAGTAVTGTAITATAGASSVTFSGISYSNVGATYSATNFWIDSGNLAAPGTVPNASTAGVAFRIGGQNFGGGNFPGTYLVGVDLVKLGDVAANAATNTVGTATIDFYLGVNLSAEVSAKSTSITGVTAQVFVAGAPTTVSGVTGNVNDSPDAIYVGQISGATGVSGGTQYLTPAGGITTTAPTAITNAVLTAGTSSLAYLDPRNSINDFITFGGLYTQINSALTAIYGSTNGTANVQWNTGDTVRFVPLSTGSILATTPGKVTSGDLMGGTVNFGITIPFGTNATAAITDAYVTGDDFSLARVSSDGFAINPVPEPATWISSGALLAVGGLLRWRRRRQQGRLAGGVGSLAPAA
jgi:hypothetical protein